MVRRKVGRYEVRRKEGRKEEGKTEGCGRKEGRKDMRAAEDDTSELAASNFSHQRAASPELVMRSLKHVAPDAAYWLTPDPRHPV